MSGLRRAVERLSRGRQVWRRLPEPFGSAKILVTPDAALSILKLGHGWVDLELLDVVDRFVKPGDVVWDIGSNLGVFGTASAVRCGKAGAVLCVEPDIYLAGLIRRTASKLNSDAAPMMVLPAAVAGEFGLSIFEIAMRGRASNALSKYKGRAPMGGVRERHPVSIVTLDSLLELSAPPAMIKIDVEGAEADVLRGATRLLHEIKPAIYIEVGSERVEEVTDQLRSASYLLFNASVPVNQQSPVGKCLWNTIALHESQVK